MNLILKRNGRSKPQKVLYNGVTKNLLSIRTLFLVMLLSFPIGLTASNRYLIKYCYVDNGAYTSWKEMNGNAIGWKKEDGTVCINLYWRNNRDETCFVIRMTNMDIYGMSKKERKLHKKANEPYLGTGYVGYYTFSGQYNLEKFPGGNAFPSYPSCSPKGQWVTSNAKFKLWCYDNHDIIQVTFNNYIFSISVSKINSDPYETYKSLF